MTIEDIAERRFAWLLSQRGCTLVRENALEAVMHVRGPRPDFHVSSPAGPFLAEVKAFVEPSIIDQRIDEGFDRPEGVPPNRVFSIDPEQLLKRIRGAVNEARRQLRAYRDLSLPRVVVLDAWRQVGVPLSVEFLVQLFGTFEFHVPILRAPGGLPRGVSLAHGRGRALGERVGEYVSAIVVTIPQRRTADDDFVDERPMKARVLHNPFATDPLPRTIFSTPEDEQFEHDGTRWTTVSSP